MRHQRLTAARKLNIGLNSPCPKIFVNFTKRSRKSLPIRPYRLFLASACWRVKALRQLGSQRFVPGFFQQFDKAHQRQLVRLDLPGLFKRPPLNRRKAFFGVRVRHAVPPCKSMSRSP